jgi:hypothetical protein
MENNKMMMQKEVVVPKFEVPSQHLPGGTHENHEKYQS